MFVRSAYRITELNYIYECSTLVQPMLVSSSLRITDLDYICGCPTLIIAYVCRVYLQNHWVTLHLWVPHHMCSLSL